MRTLNPYTLQLEPESYRPDSTMSIAIQNETYRKMREKHQKREAFKRKMMNLFRSKKK